LNYERSGPPSRATRIKQSVLGACRIRYLRCAPDHLPSIPELQLLVPQAPTASRGPQPAPSPSSVQGVNGLLHPNGRGLAHPQASTATQRRRERATLWSETLDFNDSFFASAHRFDHSSLGDLGAMSEAPDAAAPNRTAGQAARRPPATPLRH